MCCKYDSVRLDERVSSVLDDISILHKYDSVVCSVDGITKVSKFQFYISTIQLLQAIPSTPDNVLFQFYISTIQLAVYFGIGKYISQNTRKGKWGTGALEAISQILHKELPGLKGYPANSLKNMRKFYENWQMLESNSSVTNDDVSDSTIAIVELTIDIYHSMCISEIKDFPVDDFFKLSVVLLAVCSSSSEFPTN